MSRKSENKESRGILYTRLYNFFNFVQTFANFSAIYENRPIFSTCYFLISNTEKLRDFSSRGKISENLHEIKEIIMSRVPNARH